MAISPPSDIVMDVVNAADPTRVQEAQEKLRTQTATLAAARLTRQDQGFATDVASLDRAVGMRLDRTNAPHTATNVTSSEAQTPETYRKFEAMVLQNFLKYMMPNDSEDVYGKGMAGDIWKSMSAEQIANSIAKRGGIGIADHMMRGGIYDEGLKPKDHAAESGRINNVASIIAAQQQRVGMADLLPGTDTKTKG
ncbi:rod-binding protein [Rhizobium sp. C4]|uniref:rod-binding protein n=1 Tax=Rhizobium sp. C4 TaxID=1349800 RepID=UPI001E3D46C7|nr:rod-binding protein [Rhizobium sp. C4]MCD2172726.1 rod-binding protein [Rhizobium sp. C4]